MKFTTSILFAVQALSVLAIPQNRAARASAAAAAASSAAAVAAPAAGAGAGAAEENKENEVEQAGQFGQVIALGGGNIKTDTLFPPEYVNGALEVEFQNNAARQLRVTEVANPPAAPAGFTALEPVAYKIEVGGGTAGLTLQKVDYVLTAGNALDISQGKVGKLCTETNSFIIDEAVGELEFEAEENELSLTVSSLVGTWAVFVPQAAAAGGAGAAAGNATAGAGGAKAGAGAAKEGAKAGGAAGGAAGAAAGGAANNAEIKKLLEQLAQLVGA